MSTFTAVVVCRVSNPDTCEQEIVLVAVDETDTQETIRLAAREVAVSHGLTYSEGVHVYIMGELDRGSVYSDPQTAECPVEPITVDYVMNYGPETEDVNVFVARLVVTSDVAPVRDDGLVYARDCHDGTYECWPTKFRYQTGDEGARWFVNPTEVVRVGLTEIPGLAPSKQVTIWYDL